MKIDKYLMLITSLLIAICVLAMVILSGMRDTQGASVCEDVRHDALLWSEVQADMESGALVPVNK